MRHFILLTGVLLALCSHVLFAQAHEELYTIRFEKNSSRVDEKYEHFLYGLANALSADSCRVIKFIGYADSSGTEEYNDLISEKRVNSVYNYLRSRGQIDTAKIYSLQWQGESDEVYDLHLPNAHVLQRAVDIYVVFNNKGKPVQPRKK